MSMKDSCNQSTPLLCIDIGYTTTRSAIADAGLLGSVEKQGTLKSWRVGIADGELRRKTWLGWLAELVETQRQKRPDIVKVAMAFPGAVAHDGTIWRENTIWGATDTDLPASWVAECVGLPTVIFNDLTAAAMRYGTDPAYKFERFLLALSVSSGIGSKIYDKRSGRVLLERSGRNGEIGLALVDSSSEALVNRRGSRGILGNYSSGFSFAVLLRQLSLERPQLYRSSLLAEALRLSGADVHTTDREVINRLAAECISRGDEFCSVALHRSASWLARALQAMILYFPPDRIVVTGGFADAFGETYLTALREEVGRSFDSLYSREEVEQLIVPGARDDMDNLRGLAALARPEQAALVTPGLATVAFGTYKP